ncbi:unnamed protein product [Camellia sinensis]|uniref:adenylate kinase n=1 Tax=Camellia sinensis var. sinensis TaxID=542762 RepID=A0A4V3WNX0_CAMSN|nr:hypothetical protein TEA_007112 [Camellia sinensis var. sinensis]
MAALRRLIPAAQPEALRRLGFIDSRAYGSASAAQLQYDYDYEEYSDDSEGSIPGRGVQWVIMGDPLAKKQVYAERLSKLLRVPHISMGSLVRQELHPQSSLYKQISNAVNQRKLVPEDIIFGLLSKRLEEGYSKGETGFILDGIPRTRMQAEILDRIADIDLVVNFKCSEECLLKHVRNGIYSTGQEFLSMGSSGADVQGAWKEKLCIHAEQSKPLVDYYRKQKKLLDFQVVGAPGETWQGLLAALHLQHMNAVNTSQKLTA